MRDKKNDLVRYDTSDMDEEEDNGIVEYDFVNSINYNMYNEYNANKSYFKSQSEYCSELNADNRFLGMSRFDEASRAGFAVDNVKKVSKQDLTSNINIIMNYDTNLTNLNKNFNFDSEVEKIEFDRCYDKNKLATALNPDEYRDNIFENENYLNSVIFNKKINIEEDIPYNSKTTATTSKDKKDKKKVYENKSTTDLTVKVSSVPPKQVTCRSIDDCDRVNFNSISEEERKPSKKYTMSNINLNKYKVNKKEDESLDIELKCESEKVEITHKDVNSENYKEYKLDKYTEEEDLEIFYINKIQELKDHNDELKMKLKFSDNIYKERESSPIVNVDSNNEIENLKLELDELKSKLDKKSRESIEHKSKHDSLLFDFELMEKKLADNKLQLSTCKNDLIDKDSLLVNLKSELKKKEENIISLSDENKNYKSQNDNIKTEFNLHRQEMSKKAEKLTELQQKIFNLEQENIVSIL